MSQAKTLYLIDDLKLKQLLGHTVSAAQVDAVNQALNAHANGQPTYAELVGALGALHASMAHGPHARSAEVEKPLVAAGQLLARIPA